MPRRWLRPARMALLAFVASAAPTAARADSRCRGFSGADRLGMGLADCPVEVERGADRAQGDWRRHVGGREQRGRTMDPSLPGPGGHGASFLPPAQGPTREGPVGIEDLGLVADGKGGYRGGRPGYRFDIERDGTIHFRDRPPVQVAAVGLLFFAAVFDVTDLIMRAAGMDPYAYDKGRVAELTRAMRQDMGAVERPRRIAAALAQLPGDLQRLWSRSDLSVATRRELLFQLWDDLLEGEGPEGVAAARGRAEILRFVRQRLPAGTAAAFTTEELARLNARRRSRASFSPYAAGPP